MDHGSEWYRTILDAMHDMVLVKSTDSHLLWANKAFRDYYGLSEEELFAIIDAEHSDPDDTLQYVRDDLTVVETGASLDIAREAVTDANGEIRYFHTIKSPVFENGAVGRTVGVARLIDDASIAKRCIDHQDAKAFAAPIRALGENFPSPMLMVDIKGRVISASPLWKASFGATEISAESFFSDAYPDLPEIQKLLNTCIDTKTAVEKDIEYLCPNGDRRAFNARACPWSYLDGTSGGATIVATDVTALYQQKAHLGEANEELRHLSYRATHELKAPITTAKGLAGFVASDIASGNTDKAVQGVGEIVELLSRLENSVLSFLSYARADGSTSNAEIIHLEPLLQEIEPGLGALIQATGVQIQYDLGVTAFGSQPNRVRQVVENLISNGLKFNDPHKTDKWVKLKSSATPQGKIRIVVEDNGIGIHSNDLETIFNPFTRFHPRIEGTGLGLAIAKRHVMALGGGIHVEDTGDGTRFTVTLPTTTIAT